MSRPVCPVCTRPRGYCFCHLLQSVANRWPVRVLQHVEESSHPLNTARIAALSLQQCRLELVGDSFDDREVRERLEIAERAAVLVYPGTGSVLLDRSQTLLAQPGSQARPVLLFLDASWRKSRRLLLQSSWLQSLPRVALPPGLPSRYRIRREPDAMSVSTLEAIVGALALLDDCAPERMLAAMDWQVERQIAAMGPETWRRNYANADDDA